MTPGMDSNTPMYVQKLDSMRGNHIYNSIRSSVDQEQDGLLDQVVALPGRIGHQIAKGFVDSSADLVELPELIVNHVGDSLGWDEEDRLNVLSGVANSIRGAVDREDAYNTIADKIAYYIGYSIPDLLGLAIGAGVGKTATKGVIELAGRRGLVDAAGNAIRLTKSIRIPTKAVAQLGRSMGVVGFGTLKGGAFGGTEGALGAAKDFTIMEAGLYALSRYNKVTQVIGNAVLMGTMTAATADANRADYEDEVIASAILGGMFAAIPHGQKEKVLRDPDSMQTKLKAYVAREKALGREPDLNVAIAEFAGRDWQYLRKAYMQDPNAIDPLGDLKKNIGAIIGEASVSDDLNVLRKQLATVIHSDGGISFDKASLFAESFVRSADMLSNPETIKGIPVLGDFLAMHEETLIAPKQEGFTVVKKDRVITASGIEMQLSERQVQEWKKLEVENQIVDRTIAESNKEITTVLKDKVLKAYDQLFNPEGRIYNKLTQVPFGDKLQRLAKHKAYSVFDQSTAIEESLTRRADFPSFVGTSREVLDTLATVAVHEHRFLYDIAKKRTNIKHPWSKELVAAKKEWAHKWILENEGPDELARYEKALSEGWKSMWDLNEMKFRSGIINERQLKAWNAAEYLPGKRGVHWRTTKTLFDVENTILLKDDPIYHETFGFTKTDPRLKSATDEPLIYDFEYLLKTEIRKQYYGVAKNNLLRTWWESAKVGGDEIMQFARLPKFRYVIKGKKGALSDARAAEILANNEKLQKAADNVRDRRLEKIQAGEYTRKTKKEKPDPTALQLEKEIKALQADVKKLETKYDKVTDHAEGLFERFDVEASQTEGVHPKDIVIHEDTPDYRAIKSTRDELLVQKEQLEFLTKKIPLEKVIEEMHGFEPVPFLKDGKVEYVMLDTEAVQLTNMNQGLTKLQSKLLRTVSWASGVTPIKFFATAINPVFPIRRWFADNLHFYTENYSDSGNILRFMKEALLEQPEIFKDVINNGPRSTKYKELGGSILTITRMAHEDLIFKRYNKLLPSGQAKAGWNNFMDKAGWLGENIETTIRVHYFERLLKAGVPEEVAIFRVNEALNFGRKGNIMRYIDAVVPFANVAARALDAQIQSARKDPKLYAKKLSQYWMLRLTGAAVAYGIAGEVMDNVSPYHKVNNFIIPMGASTTDRNGDPQHAYIAIPTDNSPIVRAIDSMLFGMIDIMRDRTNTLGYEEIIKRIAEDVPLYDTNSLLPALQAYKAAWQNRDPRTGDNIWQGSMLVDPRYRSHQDTNAAAKNLAQVIPGTSPVGLERVGAMVGSNPFIGFFGYLLRDVSTEERNSMVRTVTDAAPGLNGILKWTRPQFAATRTMLREGASHRQRTIGLTVDAAMNRIQEGGERVETIAREIARDQDLNGAEKKDILDNIRRNIKGFTLYNKIREEEGNEAIHDLPSLREWQTISTAPTETKANWYLANVPHKADSSYRAFNALAKTHGFLSSPKFFYWLRELQRQR